MENLDKKRRLYSLRMLAQYGIDLGSLVDSLDLEDVTELQANLGVKCDGWIGPKTIRAWRAKNNYPVIDKSWTATRKRKRKKPPSCIVLHDSVTRSAMACYQVLERKRLSTHYLISESGKIYETLDPELYSGAHCRKWNRPSIGIDVISMVSAKSLRPSRAGDKARLERVIKQQYRPHNRFKSVVDYTSNQVQSLVCLVSWLCDRFNIPKRIPSDVVDYGWKLDLAADDYSGVVAHGQVTSNRWDGGMGVVHLLASGEFEPYDR